ncbi:MAG: (d)CMP kinase [Candidatus Aenigmatarchaeota archaeon]|nr:(d)CMP kinase [Candidatus Aenigmarchaeota archaeon]
MLTYIPYFYKFEKDFKKNKKIIIAISGLSGSGKGTQAKLLQKNLKETYGLNLKIFESGYFFRKISKKYGYSESNLDKFSKYLLQNKELGEKIDKEIDEKTFKLMICKDGIYVGRLTFALAGNIGYKIFLKAKPEVIAKRIISDKSRKEFGMKLKDAKNIIISRDKYDKERYKKLYSIDYDKLIKNCDLIIDNSNKTKEEVSKIIFKNVSKWIEKRFKIKKKEQNIQFQQ